MTVEREFSCGGVVVRGTDCIVIVPMRRAAGGSQVLALPKGHPEPGDHDHEVEHARWIGLAEAARSLSYKGERDMAARALLRARPTG